MPDILDRPSNSLLSDKLKLSLPDAISIQKILMRVCPQLPPRSSITPSVTAVLVALTKEIYRQEKALEQAERRQRVLEDLADRDVLLSVFNRRAFERELTRTAAIVERYGTPASIVFVDLNRFKWVNDVYGHQVGDAVLVHIANILCANVRNSDIVGRLGGDEFAVILVQADNDAANAKAERLEAIIATTPIAINGTTILLTASTGTQEITGTSDLKRNLDDADAAMYRRKAEYHDGDPRE